MPVARTRDIDTYYEETGDHGEPLLLIHGLGSNTAGWSFQAPAFASTHRVITYDLRGHGRSSHPEGPYSMPLFAADAASLLEHLHTGPAHVVGLSLGGCIAFQLALDRPDLVRSLTVVNSAPGLELRNLGDRLGWWSAVGTRWVLNHVLSRRRLGMLLARNLFPKPEQAPLRAAFIEQMLQTDERSYNASARAIFEWNVFDRVAEITCPTLIISADQDYTPVRLKAAYVARMPNARLEVIADSRHMTPLDQPARFNAALANFLARQPRAAGAVESRRDF